MKRSLFSLLGLVCIVTSFAQINTGSPTIPFGSNRMYLYGIMPTNLPTSGAYGASTKAAEAYEAWKTAYVRACGTDQYRVLYDDNTSTVSEGIGYGMLLSAYAADKVLFDGLWAYYNANLNGNGLMNWKINGCSGANVLNSTSNADLDVAMSLIIASVQWSSQSSIYLANAQSMIQKIKTYEMSSDGQLLNGDAWGETNTCRNPSYFAPAYYTEFAKVDVANATFWNTTAINASNTILTQNRNATSGLVSNWCDNGGTENACGNIGSGGYGYGLEACRNPWRMTVDYLWHGTSASTAAKDINGKLIAFVNGYENQLRGPLTNRTVLNPSGGSFINGAYTTLGLPTMTSSAAQGSLNKCYNAIAGLSNYDAYFNTTFRCLSLFVLTGNFWPPVSVFIFSPTILTSQTNGTGTEITLTASKALTASTVTASSFTLYLNGVPQTAGIASVTISGPIITLTISSSIKVQPGQQISLSYSGSEDIKSVDGGVMKAFTQIEVLNLLEGNETIIDDCEDGNELNNVGGIWYSFDDSKDQNAACKKGTISTISPAPNSVIAMMSPGYNTIYALQANYTLGTEYTSYYNGSCASWKDPSYAGVCTWMGLNEMNTKDLSGGTGISFWYKGSATIFQVITPEVADFAYFQYVIPACSDWTKFSIEWESLVQPAWGKTVVFSVTKIQKLMWIYKTGTSGHAGFQDTIGIDDVRIMNMSPVSLTSLAINIKSNSKLTDPLTLIKESTDTLKLEVTPTPTNASYTAVFWSSSDETVATVDYLGNVKAVGYGDAVITARAKMHQNISATFAVKVPAPTVKPTAISFSPTSYSVNVGKTMLLIPSFAPAEVTETGLTWKSSDEAIARVSASGVVTGIAVGGPVTVTAASTAAPSVIGTVTVKIFDTTALVDSIRTAKEIKTNARVGFGNKEYSPENIDVFATAIFTAENAVKAATQQSEIDDALLVLNRAVRVFKNSQFLVDFTPLQKAISTGSELLKGIEVGSEPCQYPAKAKADLDTQISISQRMVDADTATQLEVSNRCNELNSTIAQFENSKNPEVSKEFLITAINDAKKSFEGKVCGTDFGQYSQADSASLQTVIADAETILDQKCVTSVQIADAVVSVNSATHKFNTSAVRASLLVVSNNPIIIPQSGATETIAVTSNTRWTVSSDSNWLLLSTTTGNMNQTITVSATYNKTLASRTATVSVSLDTLIRRVTVKQIVDTFVVNRQAQSYTMYLDSISKQYNFSNFFSYYGENKVVYSAISSNNLVATAAIARNGFGFVPKGTGQCRILLSAISSGGANDTVSLLLTIKSNAVVPSCSLKTSYQISSVKCFGESTGSAVVTVQNGKRPYHYRWSTNRTDSSLVNVSSGLYTLMITDALGCSKIDTVKITESAKLSFSVTKKTPSCGLSDGGLTIVPEHEENSYVYQWNDGSTANELSSVKAGTYSATVTDTYGCTATAIIELSDADAPQITLDSIHVSSCSAPDGGAWVSVAGGTQPYTYRWNDNKADEDRAQLLPGKYSLNVVDSKQCKANFTVEIPAKTFKNPHISFVTVDTVTRKNMIVWLREDTKEIDFYRIYRETMKAGEYAKVVDIDYDEVSVYVDTTSYVNPQKRSWRYRLSAVGFCSQETEKSPEFKTMYLQKTIGLNNSINLTWDEYEGSDYYTYFIYRYSTDKLFELIDSVPASINRYTDIDASATTKDYIVTIVLPEEISPLTKFKTDTGPFSQSLSNMSEASVVGVETETTESFAVYPNPSDNLLKIKISSQFRDGVRLQLIASDGKIVFSKYLSDVSEQNIDVSQLTPGLYEVIVETNNKIDRKIIIKQ